MTLTIQAVSDASSIDHSIREFWQSHAPTPLQSPEWMLGWWAAFESDNNRLVLLVVRDADSIVGILPMIRRGTWCFGQTLRFMASGSACSDYQTILCADEHAVPVVECLAHWLLEGDGRGTWDVLELEGIRNDCPKLNALIALLSSAGCILQPTQLESTWRLDLSIGWEKFVANMAKSQRSQTRNLLNRYTKNHDQQFEVVRSPEQLQPLLRDCISLHQKRWQAAGNPGCFANQRFSNFITTAVQRLGTLGKVHFTVLRQSDRSVAVQLYLTDAANNWYLYQAGRDPELDAARVGQVLTLKSIEYACQAGCPSIDFLRGDEIYKPRLRAEPIGCWRTRAFAPSTLPKLRYGAWRVAHNLRNRALELRRTSNPSPTAAE